MAYTTIDDPAQHFNTVTYSGNVDNSSQNGSQSITGVGFQPDWVWIKPRTTVYAAGSHNLTDSVRGAGVGLFSDTTNAEYDYGTNANGGSVTAFGADGFTLGGASQVNEDSNTYVAWNWKAGGSASANSNGTISTSVSANTTAGFSIVSYTSNGTASQTVGHGLGAVPHAIISKNRDSSSSSYNYWTIYHHSLATANDKKLKLNTDDAASTTNEWGDTDPTSTKYYVHTGGDGTTNVSTDKIISYCFTGIKGYSKFGKFTGNNNADGKFVYTGFRPAWVMTKSSGTGGTHYDWVMFDNKRNTFNPNDDFLDANNTGAETTSGRNIIDFLSNGFKCRSSYGDLNSNTDYIYFAFAESPFVNSNGIPTNAR